MSPNAHTHPVLRFAYPSRLLFGLTFVLILAASISGLSGPQTATASVITPVLQRAAVIMPGGLVSVHGEGFTPGGLVQIVVGNQWDETEVHASRWIVASTESYGPHGSQDPARGYVPAGSFTEIIDLDVPATYGPNGSQDPAQGYHPGTDASILLAGGNLVVRAFDQQAGLWSNLATIDPGELLASQEIGHYDAPPACVAFIPCHRSF